MNRYLDHKEVSKKVGACVYAASSIKYLLKKTCTKRTCNRVKSSGYSNGTKGKINNKTAYKKYKLAIKKTYKEDNTNVLKSKKTTYNKRLASKIVAD